MTKTAAPALVISTAAKRSGEISRPYGTVGMEQETLPPLPAPASAGDETGSPKKVIKKAPREGELFPVLQASAAFAFLVRKY